MAPCHAPPAVVQTAKGGETEAFPPSLIGSLSGNRELCKRYRSAPLRTAETMPEVTPISTASLPERTH